MVGKIDAGRYRSYHQFYVIIPFEQIEAVVHTALHKSVGFFDNHIFHVTDSTQGLEVICNFFKEFVKNGEKDARYYKLIDEMLTYQTVRNES